MKRWIKIGAISIGSLLALIIIAVSLSCYLIFTPARLTSIVNKVAAQYLTCEMQVDEIDLTLFSSFPNLSLELDGVTLINPSNSEVSDTVASIKECEAVLDIKQFLKEGNITLRRLHVNEGIANLYIKKDGTNNFMVFATDTIVTEEDTTAFELPDIDIQQITVDGINISYRDDAAGQHAAIKDLAFAINGKLQGEQLNAKLKGSLAQLIVSMTGEAPIGATAENLSVELDGNMASTDGDFTGKIKAGSIQASLDNISTDINGIEWILDGAIKDKHITASTTLATHPIGIAMEGESPISATLSGAALEAKAQSDGSYINITPTLSLKGFDVHMNKAQMLSQANINIHLPLQTDTALQSITFNQASLSLNEYQLETEGAINMPDTATIDASLQFKTNTWDIQRLLTLVPDSYRYLLEGISIKGTTSLRGKAYAGIHHGEPSVKKAEATLTLNNIDLCYNDSIALESKAASFDITYTGANDKATGNIHAQNLDVAMTGLGDAHLTEISGKFTAKQAMRIADGKIDAYAEIASAQLTAAMDTIGLYTGHPSIDFAMKADGRNLPIYEATLHCDTLHAHMGRLMTASTGALKAEGNATYNASETDLLAQWAPRFKFDLTAGHITSSMTELPISVPQIQFDYTDGRFTINDSHILWGNSDFALHGDVTNIDSFINNTGLLKAELDFTSEYTDVTQIMDFVSGIGASDTTETVELENLPVAEEDKQEDEPFMVPLGIDVRLNTDIKTSNVGGFNFEDIGGHVTVKDGILVLEEMGFTSEAARMQLTAMYKSPRKDHLFVGFDFHLLDIEIEQLIRMIPDVDSIIPMLSAFDGEAQFHLAAETYLRSNYNPKLSTLRAAGAIEGKDLVVLDNATFDQIAKLLMFEKKTENKVDSIAVELSVFRDKVTLFPFLIAMDDYKAVIGGRHNIDNDLSFNYHISLTDCPLPIRLGLDVSGTIDNMKFNLAPCKYAHLYRPEKQNVVQERTLQLKQIISESLKDNVKEQPKRPKE